ncbi:MAG: hypothetical protein M3R25_12475 [Bacteroidota bacterium]|nr:hypothetical protein [Bacteroidota bacterium]
MFCPKAIPYLLLAFFGCFSPPADAQVNLKTGYNFSVPTADGLNHVISTWNSTQLYSTPFKLIKWLHGFEAGIRFRTGIHSFELTYQGAYQSVKAEGQVNDEAYVDKIKVAVHSGAIGYQLSDGLFGIGADLQYQFYKDKFENGSTGEKFKDVQKMTGLKGYLQFTFEGGQGVDMVLQPYMILPFKDFDAQPLARYLQVENDREKEKWIRYGISILFYNGQK